jgi:hypothetical protein
VSAKSADTPKQLEGKDFMQAVEVRTLNVTVTYVAAKEPFKQKDVSRTETVKALKAEVLNAFGLVEGPGGDGKTFTYTLFHGKTPLEDPNQTLGDLAGDKHELELKLTQQVTQG